MKNILFLLLLSPLFSIGQDKAKKFELKGTISNLPDTSVVEWVYLQYRLNGASITDSVQPQNGSYKFSGELFEPILARLRVKYAETSPGKRPILNSRRDMTSIFLESGKQRASSVDSFSNIKVKKSKAHDSYVALNKSVKPFDDQLPPLYALYADARKANNKKEMERLEGEFERIDAEKKEQVFAEFVKTKPGSPIVVYALQQYAGWDVDADKVEPLFNRLSNKVKSYPSAISLKENIDIAKKTGIGRFAMEFTQDDTLGKAVSLSAFKGKFVLIDFWASWCGPCRAENPNVVRVFNKHKDNNFHIIGISLDRPGQKEKWLKAIHDDGLAWTQLSDLKFWDNEVAKQYGIRAIPQNLLLDPEGKIIAKNVRGEELEKKVDEVILAKKGF
jgi:peroxiredoxin